MAQMHGGITIERPDPDRVRAIGIPSWPVWEKEPSTFEWTYDEPETCFFLDGDVVVTTPGGEVSVGAGDLVTFPKGLRCTWRVARAVRKHYRFG